MKSHASAPLDVGIINQSHWGIFACTTVVTFRLTVTKSLVARAAADCRADAGSTPATRDPGKPRLSLQTEGAQERCFCLNVLRSSFMSCYDAKKNVANRSVKSATLSYYGRRSCNWRSSVLVHRRPVANMFYSSVVLLIVSLTLPKKPTSTSRTSL